MVWVHAGTSFAHVIKLTAYFAYQAITREKKYDEMKILVCATLNNDIGAKNHATEEEY